MNAETDVHFGEEGGQLTYGSYLQVPLLLVSRVVSL